MKKFKKLRRGSILALVLVLILNHTVALASVGEPTKTVSTYVQLYTALEKAKDGDVIGITGVITVPSPDNLDYGKCVTLKRMDEWAKIIITDSYGYGGTAKLKGYTFEGNSTGVGGRAPFLYVDCDVEFSMCEFNDFLNQGESGGVVYVNSGNVLFSSCRFEGNTAESGGAIFNKGSVTLDNCYFVGNWAEDRGGAVYNSGNLTIENTEIKENTGRIGGGIYSWKTVEVNNSIIWANTASQGADIASEGTYTNNTTEEEYNAYLAYYSLFYSGWETHLDPMIGGAGEFLKFVTTSEDPNAPDPEDPPVDPEDPDSGDEGGDTGDNGDEGGGVVDPPEGGDDSNPTDPPQDPTDPPSDPDNEDEGGNSSQDPPSNPDNGGGSGGNVDNSNTDNSSTDNSNTDNSTTDNSNNSSTDNSTTDNSDHSTTDNSNNSSTDNSSTDNSQSSSSTDNSQHNTTDNSSSSTTTDSSSTVSNVDSSSTVSNSSTDNSQHNTTDNSSSRSESSRTENSNNSSTTTNTTTNNYYQSPEQGKGSTGSTGSNQPVNVNITVPQVEKATESPTAQSVAQNIHIEAEGVNVIYEYTENGVSISIAPYTPQSPTEELKVGEPINVSTPEISQPTQENKSPVRWVDYAILILLVLLLASEIRDKFTCKKGS